MAFHTAATVTASALGIAVAVALLGHAWASRGRRGGGKGKGRKGHDDDDRDTAAAADDIYAHLDVAVLNAHRAPLGQPQTEWMNLGWWTHTACSCGITLDRKRANERDPRAAHPKAFTDACQDLASMLWAHAGSEGTDALAAPHADTLSRRRPLRVLDVGFGYGQSLLSFLEQQSIHAVEAGKQSMHGLGAGQQSMHAVEAEEQPHGAPRQHRGTTTTTSDSAPPPPPPPPPPFATDPCLTLHGVTLSPAEHARACKRVKAYLDSFQASQASQASSGQRSTARANDSTVTLPTTDANDSTVTLPSDPHLGTTSTRFRRGNIEVSLACSDATAFLQGAADAPPYDYIFALDCAYHMDRAAFFQAAYRRLRPGGTLALFDLLRGEGRDHSNASLTRRPTVYSKALSFVRRTFAPLVPTLAFRAILAVSGASLLTRRQYIQVLRQAGFADGDQVSAQICDVTPHVLPGFACFLSEVGSSSSQLRLPALARYGLRVFGWLVGKWARAWHSKQRGRAGSSGHHHHHAPTSWAQVEAGIIVARKAVAQAPAQ